MTTSPGSQPDDSPADFEEAVYDALRHLAAAHLRHERASHTLQPTALVHEAWMRLGSDAAAQHATKDHFLALASRAMRRVLVDHARSRGSAKRGGAWQRVTVAGDAAATAPEVDVVELDEVLGLLAEASPRQAQIVELRFFGGLSIEEVASVIDVSVPTVVRDWRVAQAWLLSQMTQE